jgi:hypothetical protein
VTVDRGWAKAGGLMTTEVQNDGGAGCKEKKTPNTSIEHLFETVLFFFYPVQKKIIAPPQFFRSMMHGMEIYSSTPYKLAS